MNFFAYQEQARRMTVRLVILYAASLLLVFAAIHLLVAAIVGNVTGEIRQDNASSYSPPSSDPFDLTLYAFRDPLLLLIDLSAVTLIIGGGTLYKISELKRLDGDGIASHLGGKRLTKTPDVPWRERRLLNIVEEMAIAAGINTPNVYILRGEQSINAFAAGFSLPTSVVAVTQGAVEYLTRDELQGVIGHEFSHILNQDTRLNMKLIGILFGLEMLAIFGYIAMRIGMEISFYAPRTSRKNDDSQSAVLGFALACFAVGLILLLIGLIGQLFANIIRAAISRQREYLADASAVQFTRNPEGIAGALKKIGSDVGAHISNNNAAEASHLFISNIFGRGFFSHLFDSHPSLTDRIKRLEPNFDGIYPRSIQKVTPETDSPDRPPVQPFRTAMEPLRRGTGAQPAGNAGPQTIVGAAVTGALLGAAAPRPNSGIRIADTLAAEIPPEAESVLESPAGGSAALLAVLIDGDARLRERELCFLRERIGSETTERIVPLIEALDRAPETVKIPIVQKAFPLLRSLSKEEYCKLRDAAGALINFDGKIDLLEFTIYRFVFGDLDIYFRISRPKPEKYGRPEEVLEPLRQAASHIAYAGSDDPAECQRAFSLFCGVLGVSMTLLPKSGCTFRDLGHALDILAQTKPLFRQKILEGFYACVNADGYVNEREGELIRAVTACFHAPMPAWGTPTAAAS